MLSHWVSVSAGNPAIAVARKVGVLGAPEIENGSKNRARNRSFFQCFFLFSKNHEKTRKVLVFQYFSRFLAHQNGSKIEPFLSVGHSFLAHFFGHRFAWAFWSSFGSPLAPFGSLLVSFGSLLAPFGSFWLPLGSFCDPFGYLWLPFGCLWLHFGTLWFPFRTVGFSFHVFRLSFLIFQVSSDLSARFLPELRKIDRKRNGFSILNLSHNLFLSCHVFSHPISKKTRTRLTAPPSKASFRSHLTFRGPGAGICRRQLRSSCPWDLVFLKT